MIIRKYKKLLIIGFCIIFAIMSISMAVMAGDVLHINHCCIEDCPVCNIINMSVSLIENMTLTNSSILILIAIVPLMKLILEYIENEKKQTLVELKVILNN